ncbi:MAG: hypothetical protein RLZZ589_1595, partial [Cyanobacteriota bacterium]
MQHRPEGEAQVEFLNQFQGHARP